MKEIKAIFIMFLVAIILMTIHVLGIYLIGDIGFMVSPYFFPLFICAILSILLFIVATIKLIIYFINKTQHLI